MLPQAHSHLSGGSGRRPNAGELHTRILWGMFTGAYSYTELLRMSLSPRLVSRLALALERAGLQSSARQRGG
jgi:hypothetical protein